MDAIIKKLMENRKDEFSQTFVKDLKKDDEKETPEKELEEDFDPMFDEDLKKYIGKPMKELLMALSGKVKLNIENERPDHYGTSGFSGMCNQVGWHYADMIIKDIRASDNRYVDVYINL